MAIEFTFTEEQELFRRSVTEFLETEIEPHVAGLDKSHSFPHNLVDRLAAQGLMGVPIPRKYGGAGLGEVGYCILLEELSRVDASLATIVGAHTGIGAQPIYLFGTEAQRSKCLPELSSGRAIGAFSLTEPQAGSDAANLKTTAVKRGGEYVLNGTKIYVTNGDVAKYIVVMALTDPALGARGGVTAFIVERGLPGLKVGAGGGEASTASRRNPVGSAGPEEPGIPPGPSGASGLRVGRLEDKMGIRGSTTAELIFEDCVVPEANVLGQVGAGLLVALTALDGGRVALGAGVVGGARGAIDEALLFAKRRKVKGEPISAHQSVQFLLADSATEIHAARLAAYNAARLVDDYYDKIAKGEKVPKELRERVSREAAHVKIFCSEAASRAVDRAVEVMGARGVIEDYGMARRFRDSVISEIFEGTNEIQRLIAAKDLLDSGRFA